MLNLENPIFSYQVSEDQWKRRKHAESESAKATDERQIIRVAQQSQPQLTPKAQSGSQAPQSSQQQQQQQQFHSIEPVSPPEANTNHYARRYYESTTATTTSGASSNKSHISPLDYVKNKIVEVMRTEDDKGSAGDRNNGTAGSEKDDKAPAPSPSGGEMVIDESPQPSPPTSLAPSAPTTFYPFSALGVHTGPPPAPPVTLSANLPKNEQMLPEPAPLLSAQYEPLSDED